MAPPPMATPTGHRMAVPWTSFSQQLSFFSLKHIGSPYLSGVHTIGSVVLSAQSVGSNTVATIGLCSSVP